MKFTSVFARLNVRAVALAAVLAVALTGLLAPAASAIELGPRRIEVTSAVDVRAGLKISQDIMKFNDAGNGPIYLLIVASGGTAQGAMLVADTIKSVESPVVAVVLAPVSGAGAALAVSADQLVMLPSAELHFTDVDYEGVAKAEAPKPDAPALAPDVVVKNAFQQRLRTDYLKRFWTFVAKRIGESEGKVAQTIEKEGGLVFTAQDAQKKKIAAEIVTRIEASRLSNEKTEVKAISIRNLVKTSPPPVGEDEVR